MVVGGQILDRRGPRQALAVAMLVALLAPTAGSTETANAAPFALPASEFATMDQPTGDFAETSPVEETSPNSPVSADKPMFELRGRIDADAIWAQQSAANIADFGKLEDVVGLRRARIGVQGHLNDDLRYVSEIDLATGDVVVRDCFLGWAAPHVQNRQFSLGHFREPFSLEGGISANVFPFLERSPINNLDPSRNWGFGLYQHDDDEAATFAIGLFHAGTDPSDFQGGEGANTALTARGTFLPWDTDDHLVHLGLAASLRIPDRNVVKIGQGPASPLLDFQDSSTSPFVFTLLIPAQSQQLLNLQAASLQGAWLTQAEWYGTWIDQIGGGPVFLHGSYVQTSYMLTGERRTYEREDAVLGGIQVERPVTPHFADNRCPPSLGYGAWELTSRFAYLDYADPNLPLGPQGQRQGVELAQMTVGVNWYLADRLRILFNYSYAVPVEPNNGVSAASIFSTRVATFW